MSVTYTDPRGQEKPRSRSSWWTLLKKLKKTNKTNAADAAWRLMMENGVSYSPWCPIEAPVLQFADRSTAGRARGSEDAEQRQRLTATALRGELDPARQSRLLALLARKGENFRLKESGPVALTDGDREAIRRLGRDPDRVGAALTARNAGEYRQLLGGRR